MKNSVLMLACLLLSAGMMYGQVPKLGYGDTIDGVNDMDPTYFSNYWFDDWFDSMPRTNIIRVPYHPPIFPDTLPLPPMSSFTLNRCDTVSRYFYTDHPIQIAGIAISLAYFRNWDENGYELNNYRVRSDTTSYHDNLFLQEDVGDSLVMRATVPMPPDLSVSHRYLKLPVDWSIDSCAGGTEVTEEVFPIYERYFSNPVTVNGSFYVGMSLNYRLWLEGHWKPKFDYVVFGVEEDVGFEGHTSNNTYPCENPSCQRMPQTRYRCVRVILSVPEYEVVDCYNSHEMLFIFPIMVADTVCGMVKSVSVVEADSGRARLVWDRTEGHTWWEVSYGPAGVSADSGTVVVCSDTTAVLEGVADGVRYWAYVRAVCERYHETYYSEWSEPVEIYNPIMHTLTAEANYAGRGEVAGGGLYEDGEEAVLSARAWRPYIFLRWDDGEAANPRRVVVTQDTAFTAIFVSREAIGEAVAEAVGFALLPNPAWESVRCVLYGCTESGGTVTVCDMTGREVLRKTLAAGTRTLTLDVVDYPSGTYFVTLTTAKGTSTQKLVVEEN